MSRILTAKARREPPTPRDYRKELWFEVFVAVARAEDCKNPTIPPRWANHALAEFDRTFGPEGTSR